MTNIIDYTYFRGKLLVPNAVETSIVQTLLTTMIIESQAELLNAMLGPVLYGQFVTWYTKLPLDTANPFNDLLNGKVFTDSRNQQVNWIGLANTYKLSPIANYTYTKWQESVATQSVSMGEVQTDSQNATPASANTKYIQAWNDMVKYVWTYKQFMDEYFGTNDDWLNYTRHYVCNGFYSQEITKKVNFLDA